MRNRSKAYMMGAFGFIFGILMIAAHAWPFFLPDAATPPSDFRYTSRPETALGMVKTVSSNEAAIKTYAAQRVFMGFMLLAMSATFFWVGARPTPPQLPDDEWLPPEVKKAGLLKPRKVKRVRVHKQKPHRKLRKGDPL